MNPPAIIVALGDTAQRQRISGCIRSAPDLTLAAQTGTLMETFSSIEETAPNAVLIGRSMTRFAEFEVMRGLFQALEIRWIVLEDESRAAAQADRRFAAASGLFPLDPSADRNAILTQIRAVLKTRSTAASPRPAPFAPSGGAGLILIGASTGGVDALSRILGSFPANCPATVVVQHTGQGFGTSLARLLDRQCAPDVLHARDNIDLCRGRVVIGAGMANHVQLAASAPRRITLGGTQPVSGHLPSIDQLFRSAVPQARGITAALLTGMGRDGAEGLLALRSAGANTFAQDAASCVVYGMPRIAMEIGAVDHQLPLEKMAEALLTSASRQKEAAGCR